MDSSCTRAIEVNGQKLHMALDGRYGAPWLVFSNSLATDLHLWDRQVEALADDWRILRYDFRGHGGSGPSANADFDTSILADDVLAVMDAVGAKRAHHIGVSMGALAGLAAAARVPQRFASLVVCNSRLRSTVDSSADLKRRAYRALEQGMQALVEPTLQKWFGEARLPLCDTLRQQVADMIANTWAADFAAYARGMRNYDLKSNATDLPMPVLLLAGSDDGTIPGNFQTLNTIHPNLRCILIDGAGHLPNLQAEKEFNSHLVNFLGQSRNK
jgi:3-oxoadipate enol-lactonase